MKKKQCISREGKEINNAVKGYLESTKENIPLLPYANKKSCIKVYLSGKMTGLTPKEFSRNFKEAEKKVKKDLSKSYDKVLIVNPDHKSINTKHGWCYEDCMETDFNAIKLCDAIFMLKNWETSNGAKRELMIAKGYQKIIILEEPIKNYCNNCVYHIWEIIK
jgi:hypothetical protein